MKTYIRLSAVIRAAAAAIFVLAALSQPVYSCAAGIDVSARAALVMDADTGRVIIAKNIDKRLPPASTTKVMTAILALENLEMDKILKVSRLASRREPSKVNLRCGDEATVEALMYSLLVKSANDAATVLAEGIAGSVGRFTVMMNDKARELGAKNTNFRTASGLPADGQYSTVYDLAVIFRYALGMPGFVEIASTRYATLHLGGDCDLALKNSNKLLWIYDGAVVGKTGYTREARDCYVGLAECGGRRLIVSLLGSEVRWEDATRLLDTGFALAEKGGAIVQQDKIPTRSAKRSSSREGGIAGSE